ncbi:hypothetical protein [Nonomuraea sp. NPDC005692]|uniref:hypothetical protein n=1 Tax=Nonomuraea sp. NPDC005692 TaxID=3157168 RepID=UPI0033CF68EF
MSTATNSSWRPLRERMAGVTGERALVEGTPDYLLEPLRAWLGRARHNVYSDLGTRLPLRLRRTDVFVGDGGRQFVMLDGEDLLEAIDAAMDLNHYLFEPGADPESNQRWAGMLVELRMMLEDGGSAWKPKDDYSGLTRRVDATVTEAARAAMKAAPPDASAHLRQAWDAAYGFAPDATRAYSEAVKAVEAVVIPHTIPNDQVATLGKAINHIKDTAAKWTIAVDQSGTPAPADALLAMLRLVWHGQSDRHAGPNTAPVTLESAQTALHVAVALVQWFTSGAVKKAP